MNLSDHLPEAFSAALDLPLVAAPMFLVSGIDLIAAACLNGVIGSMPSGNARTPDMFDEMLAGLTARLAGKRAAPWAINLVAHRTNARLKPDLDICVKYRAPLVITALGGPQAVVEAVHSYGGLVFADVNSPAYARKAAAWGVDGLVLVCAGAGGHTGPMAMPAFIATVREFWQGIICVAGAMTDGASLRAAQIMGADLVYMGTRFIATQESLAVQDYKQMLVDSKFEDIMLTDKVTGAWSNKLRPSLVRVGLDPDNLADRGKFDLSNRENDIKAWKHLWSAGQGVGQIKAIEPAATVIDRIKHEYACCIDAELDDCWVKRHLDRQSENKLRRSAM